jgi:hypothetical protein
MSEKLTYEEVMSGEDGYYQVYYPKDNAILIGILFTKIGDELYWGRKNDFMPAVSTLWEEHSFVRYIP